MASLDSKNESISSMLVTQCPSDDDESTNVEEQEETSANAISTLLGPSEITSQRKNSSSDLHSRLKTRKVLGVGEIRDDGDIYRSKISQILGHSEHLYVKLPKGLFYWQATHVAYFFGSGLLCILLPQVAASLEMFYFSTNAIPSDVVQWQFLPVRFYGSALIGLSALYRGLMLTSQRQYISSGLLGCSVVFGLQVLISLPWAWSYRHQLSGIHLFTLASKIIFGIFGNYIYYEITRPSSSSSLGLSRLLRKFGLFFGLIECIGGSRTPATSPSTYSFANAVQTNSSPIESERKSENSKPLNLWTDDDNGYEIKDNSDKNKSE